MKLFLLFLVVASSQADYVVKEDEDKKEDDVVGIGLVYRPSDCGERTTRKGDLLRVYFNGSLADGSFFDTTYNNKPFEFVLGEGQVIQGWEAGLLDMCKGEVRHLSIPPMYAWGHGGMGGIPSRVTLYFFVRLESFHAIADAPRKINTFAIIDVNQDGLLSRDEVKSYLTNSGIQDVEGIRGVKQMLRDVFKEEDRDHNGYIQYDEFSGRKHYEL